MFNMGHKTLSHERCHQYFNLIFMYITKTDNRIEKKTTIVGNLHNNFALVMGSECNWSRKDNMERRRGIRHASP